MLVGFAAGGATDTIARLYGQKLSEILGVPVVVDNKPGASQLVAIRTLQSAAPDGYTLALVGGSALTQGPAVRKDLGYDPLKDFALISFIGTALGVVTVSPNLPVKTMSDLVSYAKARPDTLTYASAGAGSAGHLEGAYIMKATGTKITHVPYKSDGEAMRAVAAGDVQVGVTTAQLAAPLISSGKARAILLTTTKQFSYMPNVPNLHDAKVPGLDGLDPYTFFGVVGPVGMTPATVDRLNETFNKVSAMTDVAERMRSSLFTEPGSGTPAAFRSFVEREYAKWREVGNTVAINQ
jgi:tripartite-type tricarboxylate transporter receptor subunit TctC